LVALSSFIGYSKHMEKLKIYRVAVHVNRTEFYDVKATSGKAAVTLVEEYGEVGDGIEFIDMSEGTVEKVFLIDEE